MKLIRLGEEGKEIPAVLNEEGKRLDVSAFCANYDEQFFGDDGVNKLQEWLKDNAASCPVVDDSVRIGCPVARPSKVIAIGLNYSSHAKETGMEPPPEPIIFFKSTTSVCGPNDNIIIPRNSKKTDWEVELGVVIGKKASYITEAEANDYIAGYTLINDVSEREFQLERAGQWVKGKSNDNFTPIGPWLVTKDEAGDVGNLDLWLNVNGERKQGSNTSDMIFTVPFIVSYLTNFMTLLPGDVITTGTPFGVGMGLKPQQFLKPGDVVELGVENLGEARQGVVDAD
ncbi:MAG: fumarylacetoacetate hydrolase family protein [Flavobacteriales bacterium]|nr:fumarylacetoacetate hydrolase family protein [Flavobacteriales bacterium]